MRWRTRWGGKQELRTLKENGIVDIGANEFIKMAKILGYEQTIWIFLLKTFPKRTTNDLRR